MDVRNTLLHVCCSMMQVSILPIRLAKRFFAFFEMGVTDAVCMGDLELDVCNLDDDEGLVEI